MSKLPLLDLQDQAFKLYLSGVIPAEIARRLGLSANTVSAWKISQKWDENKDIALFGQEQLKTLQENVVPTSNEIMDQIRIKIVDALKDVHIKPTKWKDVVDTLQLLTRDLVPVKANNKQHKEEIDVTDMNDKDLDREIEELQGLLNKSEVAEIVLDKDDITEVEPNH